MGDVLMDPARARRRQAERRRRRVRRVVRALVASLAAFAAAVVSVRAVYAGQALPRTSLSGADIGGKSREEVRALVAARAARPLTLRAGSRRIALRRADAGLAVDIDGSVARALEAGRRGLLDGALSTVDALLTGRKVPLLARIDERRLRTAVDRVADRVDRAPFAGALRVDPQTLAVAVRPPREGRRVRRAVLLDRVRRALIHGTTAVEVPVGTRAAVSLRSVQRAAAQARRYLRAPLRLHAAGRDIAIGAPELAPVLTLVQAGRRSARLGADRGALDRLTARVAGTVDRPARSARLDAPARPVIVEGKGDLAWRPREAQVTIRPARPGRALARDTAVRRIDAAIRRGAHEVALDVRRVAPAVTTAAARGADALIGTFTTRYEPGQPRVTNIRRIARTVDGTVIPPGGTFSLNAISGPRTTAGGYVKAPFIADDKIVPSVGGGVSQFSTTTYNAAYFAGLRLDAHRAHSLYIDRYPPGREATLNFPDIDLRWTNDTTAPVLVRAVTDATSVTVSLYGDNGGRRVSARTGARRPVPGGDFAITVTRVIRYADGRTIRQPVTTTYRKAAD
ncbi:MAG TPA: VanW family protein [Baekduia sp.]|nr:VanW family protein [Baekduia sp.]